jgi:hypothetical protein
MKRAEPGWLVLALAGIAALIGSFLPFYTFGGTVELTVWNRTLFPTATLIPLLVFGIGLEGLFVLLMGHEPRSPFLSFTWTQARLAGAAFAIVLSLSYLVQGRAGGDLGSGYLIMSLATLASFAGAVMTRRAALARGREQITPAEHPWRAAFLRWQTELTEKVEAYAAGGSESGAQPASGAAATPGTTGGKEPDSTSDDETPEPIPIPRLSAVQTEPEPDDKPAADGGEPATDDEASVEGDVASDSEVAAEGDTAADGDVAAEDDVAAAEDDDSERERPAAPG